MARTFKRKALRIRKSTADAFWDKAAKSAVPYEGPNGVQLYFVCPYCQNWFEYEAFDMGHIVPWAKFLAACGLSEENEEHTWAMAQDAFNYLDNLTIQCTTCNRGHAWEEELEDDELDDDDVEPETDDDDVEPETDGEFDDFIVPDCPTCGMGGDVQWDDGSMSNDNDAVGYFCRVCGNQVT